MKNTLYEVLDRITMVFSPLVESLFDQVEGLSARRGARKGKRRQQMAATATALGDERSAGTRGRESFGW